MIFKDQVAIARLLYGQVYVESGIIYINKNKMPQHMFNPHSPETCVRLMEWVRLDAESNVHDFMVVVLNELSKKVELTFPEAVAKCALGVINDQS